MRILIALGGNALLRRSDPMTTEVQRRNIMVAAQAIAPLATEHSVVIVHGSAPFSLAVGALQLGIPGLPGPAPPHEPNRGRPAQPVTSARHPGGIRRTEHRWTKPTDPSLHRSRSI
jgi:hypothetical protein